MVLNSNIIELFFFKNKTIMSRSQVKIENDVSDDEDIDPSELIDTQENKPKITQQENLTQSDEPVKESRYRRIEHKPVS